MENSAPLKVADPAVWTIIQAEALRQENGLELIASENFVSPAVMEAAGSVLTNKYAEGYPGKRYYGGCEEVDKVETLAIARALQLFGAEAANVQPHSGSQANMAAYMALMEPGDALLAMDLNSGGHLTHGAPFNFSGKLYKVAHYGLRRDTEQIDYDQVRELALQHRPKVLVAGASAYPRIIDFGRFRAVADEVGAALLVDMAHIAGLVAAGLHPSPVPLADVVTSTTHKTLRGPRSGMMLFKEKYAKAINGRIFPGIQGGPLMHSIAGKAVAFGEALQPSFKAYQAQTVKNAQALAAALVEGGLRICSGGTDNHLMLVDLRPLKVTGKAAEDALGHAGITVNKNQIPFDPEKANVSSGIRLGTPAMTTRGLKEGEMREVARLIVEVLKAPQDTATLARVKDQARALVSAFPLYRGRPQG